MSNAPLWRVDSVPDARDPRLAPYRDLTDVELRRSVEARNGLFMAEGLLVIERAVSMGLVIESVLSAPKWLNRLATILSDWPGTIYVADDEILREVTGYRVHRGALACVRRPPIPPLADIAEASGDLLVLGDLVDHTNVGLSMRSAAALGVSGAVLSPACADPLYRRAVKSSMGAVLALPWTRAERWPDDLGSLGSRALVALTPDPAAPVLDEVLDRMGRSGVALVVGSEGPGLSDGELDLCHERARISMDAGVDSLNVAAAVAVACYALRMRRIR